MPIGATIGAAVIGGGAAIFSSSQAAKAQNKAAQTAAATQQNAATTTSDMALRVANTNNAFAQSIYSQNEAHLNPDINFGVAAGNNEMGLLLGNPPATPSIAPTWGNPTGTPAPASAPTPTPTPAQAPAPPTGYTGPGLGNIGSQGQMDAYMAYYQAHPELDPGFTNISQFHGDPYRDESSANAVLAAHNAYVASHPAPAAAAPAAVPPATPAVVAPNNAVAAIAPAAPVSTLDNRPHLSDYSGDPAAFRTAIADWRDNRAPAGAGAAAAAATGQPPATSTPAPPAGTPPATPPATPNAAQNAWDTFRNSTNYQFRLNQGLDSTATKYAAAGAFESGAEKKAINDYAQNFASNELSTYMDRLYQQEALGASAASSLAGVGTNLVSQVSSNNNNAATTAINGTNNAANASGNAALIAGQGSANNWNNVGSAVGTAAGSIAGALGSSYAQPNPNAAYAALQNSGIYAGTGFSF